ncbi:hypothetical protein UFOVP1665_9 [uncultured Caudovirales phage]|uniref:Uncharacterized protein n=1 Tax=uncultured Caudovirales phage TaxID=2100421 RepID=A0A6J5T8F7_9CAUD|nr:hypothetical protein UFOVP1665_9 [uncultured Caudovirales phage]
MTWTLEFQIIVWAIVEGGLIAVIAYGKGYRDHAEDVAKLNRARHHRATVDHD